MPVAAKIALATAGTMAEVPHSPMPPARSLRYVPHPRFATFYTLAGKRVIDAWSGPVIRVGRSCGGGVIMEAGVNPEVATLVYVAAFAPPKGAFSRSLPAADFLISDGVAP